MMLSSFILILNASPKSKFNTFFSYTNSNTVCVCVAWIFDFYVYTLHISVLEMYRIDNKSSTKAVSDLSF